MGRKTTARRSPATAGPMSCFENNPRASQLGLTFGDIRPARSTSPRPTLAASEALLLDVVRRIFARGDRPKTALLCLESGLAAEVVEAARKRLRHLGLWPEAPPQPVTFAALVAASDPGPPPEELAEVAKRKAEVDRERGIQPSPKRIAPREHRVYRVSSGDGDAGPP